MLHATVTEWETLQSPKPNSFGIHFFDFQDVYPLTGGDLAIEFSHTGGNLTGALVFDAVQTNRIAGVAYSYNGFRANNGQSIVFPVTRLHYGFGSSCPGSDGAKPILNLTTNTVGGGLIQLAIGNGRRASPMVLGFGSVRTNVPLPGGCTLWTTPLVTLPGVTDALGRHLTNLAVPASVVGTMEIQAFVVDPGAVSGFTATNGVTLTTQ